MIRRYGILSLAVLALLLLNLGRQEAASPTPGNQGRTPTTAGAPPTSAPQHEPARISADAATPTRAEPLPPSWRAMPDELIQQLASDISDSALPLAERMANLTNMEADWLDGGESLTGLQGRYALAMEQLAEESEQLPLAERLASLTRLQDQWAAAYPDLAEDLFNRDARLQQARQLWGDEELATLARHFLPREQADATLAFADVRQQQLDQRSRYQQQLAELELQLAASQSHMTPERWQQHREEVLSQWRREFFTQEQANP